MASQAATAKVSNDEWARHKEPILDLYVGEDLTLQELAGRMEHDHGFRASISQFEAQLKKWGARKNLKTHEWKPVFDRIDRIPRGINSRVVICGRVMTSARLRRARKHCRRNCGRLTDSSLRGMPRNNQRSSNTTEQVHIETQDIDGKWIRLEDSNPPSPVEDKSAAPASVKSHGFQTPKTSLYSTLRVLEVLNSILQCPLETLTINHSVLYDSTGLRFHITALHSEQYSIIKLNSPYHLQQERSQSQGLISMGAILETNILRLLIFSLANGFTRLDDIPMENLIKGENILGAAIKAKENRSVNQILEMKIVDLNDTWYTRDSRKLTPAELAATLGDFETMKTLLDSGAEINKSYIDYNLYENHDQNCEALDHFLAYLVSEKEVKRSVSPGGSGRTWAD
ncbi:hypothetical protein F5X96DRAFT_674962 [Biscogniauxia mediterranea]|nr:hypothetical protein F5X96DRAFT_674962 [Biscogniauxia mediterranea]